MDLHGRTGEVPEEGREAHLLLHGRGASHPPTARQAGRRIDGTMRRRGRVRLKRTPRDRFIRFTRCVQNGTERTITDAKAWVHWMETCWAMHPPKLTVLDSAKLVQTHEHMSDELHSIFDRYDVDKSGGLSASETKDMLLELDLSFKGISKADIATYIHECFQKADLNSDGRIDFNEFAEYYNTMQAVM